MQAEARRSSFAYRQLRASQHFLAARRNNEYNILILLREAAAGHFDALDAIRHVATAFPPPEELTSFYV